MRSTFFLLTLTSLLLTACSGPKALTKRGMELQDAGMYKQAAEMYYLALRKKRGMVDAMVGLRSAGQGYIDTQVGDFQRASLDGRRADALKLYDDMLAYRTRISSVDVDLLIPASVTNDYENHLDDHLVELDEQGHAQLESEDFAGAAETFQEIIRLDPEYKDAQSLLIIARAEPLYRQAESDLSNNAYRAAYEGLEKVLALDAAYKDATSLLEQALEEGRFNLAVLTFDSRRQNEDVALELRSGVQNGLIQSNDPFIGVVDRTQREEILAEQQLSISGISDEQVEVGEIAGARAMLTGAILMYAMETGSPLSTPRPGFRKYFKEVQDEEGKTKKVAAFAPAQYVLHSQNREVILKYELKLVSTETSQVLYSKVDEVRGGDAVEFATSLVQAGSLYPARSNGEVNRNGKSEMSQLLGARRELMPESTLRNQVLQEATRRCTRQVESFLSEYIK